MQINTGSTQRNVRGKSGRSSFKSPQTGRTEPRDQVSLSSEQSSSAKMFQDMNRLKKLKLDQKRRAPAVNNAAKQDNRPQAAGGDKKPQTKQAVREELFDQTYPDFGSYQQERAQELALEPFADAKQVAEADVRDTIGWLKDRGIDAPEGAGWKELAGLKLQALRHEAKHLKNLPKDQRLAYIYRIAEGAGRRRKARLLAHGKHTAVSDPFSPIDLTDEIARKPPSQVRSEVLGKGRQKWEKIVESAEVALADKAGEKEREYLQKLVDEAVPEPEREEALVRLRLAEKETRREREIQQIKKLGTTELKKVESEGKKQTDHLEKQRKRFAEAGLDTRDFAKTYGQVTDGKLAVLKRAWALRQKALTPVQGGFEQSRREEIDWDRALTEGSLKKLEKMAKSGDYLGFDTLLSRMKGEGENPFHKFDAEVRSTDLNNFKAAPRSVRRLATNRNLYDWRDLHQQAAANEDVPAKLGGGKLQEASQAAKKLMDYPTINRAQEDHLLKKMDELSRQGVQIPEKMGLDGLQKLYTTSQEFQLDSLEKQLELREKKLAESNRTNQGLLKPQFDSHKRKIGELRQLLDKRDYAELEKAMRANGYLGQKVSQKESPDLTDIANAERRQNPFYELDRAMGSPEAYDSYLKMPVSQRNKDQQVPIDWKRLQEQANVELAASRPEFLKQLKGNSGHNLAIAQHFQNSDRYSTKEEFAAFQKGFQGKDQQRAFNRRFLQANDAFPNPEFDFRQPTSPENSPIISSKRFVELVGNSPKHSQIEKLWDKTLMSDKRLQELASQAYQLDPNAESRQERMKSVATRMIQQKVDGLRHVRSEIKGVWKSVGGLTKNSDRDNEVFSGLGRDLKDLKNYHKPTTGTMSELLRHLRQIDTSVGTEALSKAGALEDNLKSHRTSWDDLWKSDQKLNKALDQDWKGRLEGALEKADKAYHREKFFSALVGGFAAGPVVGPLALGAGRFVLSIGADKLDGRKVTAKQVAVEGLLNLTPFHRIPGLKSLRSTWGGAIGAEVIETTASGTLEAALTGQNPISTIGTGLINPLSYIGLLSGPTSRPAKRLQNPSIAPRPARASHNIKVGPKADLDLSVNLGKDRAKKLHNELQDLRKAYPNPDQRSVMEWSTLNKSADDLLQRAVRENRITAEEAADPATRNRVAWRMAKELKKEGKVTAKTLKHLSDFVFRVSRNGNQTQLETAGNASAVISANRAMEANPPKVGGDSQLKVYRAHPKDVAFVEQSAKILKDSGLETVLGDLREVHFENQLRISSTRSKSGGSHLTGETRGRVSVVGPNEGAIVIKRKFQVGTDAPFLERFHTLVHESAHHRDRAKGFASEKHPAFRDRGKKGFVTDYAATNAVEDYAETVAYVVKNHAIGPSRITGGQWNDVVAAKVKAVVDDLGLPASVFAEIVAANRP